MYQLLSLWKFLNFKRRLEIICSLIMMLISSFAELASLGAFIPFLAALSEPEVLWEQPLIRRLAHNFGITEASNILTPFIIIFIILVIVSAGLKLLNKFISFRLVASIGTDLNTEIYRNTLYQTYETHIKQNSSMLLSTITDKINRLTSTFNASLQLISSLILSISILIGFTSLSWALTTSTFVSFALIYVLIGAIVSKKIKKNSRIRRRSIENLLKLAQESIGAIRDIILDNNYAIYINSFESYDKKSRDVTAINSTLKTFPRYLLEALGLISISIYAAFIVSQSSNPALVIPTLGALALGAQKLLPNIQLIFASWASIKDASSEVHSIVEILNRPVKLPSETLDTFIFDQSINIKDLSYGYSKSNPLILERINLKIKRGEVIGLTGTSGSGKSTLVDIIMGLLKPSSGTLCVDKINIFEPKNSDLLITWRSSIAHVPQSIFLVDGSIAENIALGIVPSEIDMDKVRLAACQAGIIDFINSSGKGFDCIVGERGIGLSGGQRQRIGIARALYKDAQILILDEATSALDIPTEEKIMETIEKLTEKLTIIIIAHRTSTLRMCSKIYHLSNKTLTYSIQK